MANNVNAVKTIKDRQLNTIYEALKRYEFECFVPITLDIFKAINAQCYARAIGNKDGRNSGLAFVFRTVSGIYYGLSIKRHAAPNYSQYDFETVFALPNNIFGNMAPEDGYQDTILNWLDMSDVEFGLTFDPNTARYLWAFDMIEEEYFEGIGNYVYFVTKNTVLNTADSKRFHFVYFAGHVAEYDAQENPQDRHYDLVDIFGIYNLKPDFATLLRNRIIEYSSSLIPF